MAQNNLSMIKRLFSLLLVALSVNNGVFAQKGTHGIGFSGLFQHTFYDSETFYWGNRTHPNKAGIGVVYQYNLTDRLCLVPSVNYFFVENPTKYEISYGDYHHHSKGEEASFYSFRLMMNADIHYLLGNGRRLRPFVMSGLFYADVPIGGDYLDEKRHTRANIGVNVGFGVDWHITPHWMLEFAGKGSFGFGQNGNGKETMCVIPVIANVGILYNF